MGETLRGAYLVYSMDLRIGGFGRAANASFRYAGTIGNWQQVLQQDMTATCVREVQARTVELSKYHKHVYSRMPALQQAACCLDEMSEI